MQNLARCAVGLWLSMSVILTSQRVTVWQSERRLWQDAHAKAPTRVRPAVNLGRAYLVSGDLDHATIWLEYAARLASNPNRLRDEQHYGGAYAQTDLVIRDVTRGAQGEATLRLKQLLTATPDFASARALCSISVDCR